MADETKDEPAGTPPPSDSQAVTERSRPGESSSRSRGSDAWIGGAVWIVGLAIAAYVWFFDGRVDVFLNVSAANPVVAEGTVTNEGVPVSSGTVQVRVEDPLGERLLASGLADVTATGRFRLDLPLPLPRGAAKEMRVTGYYTGTTSGENGKALSGTEVVYVNMAPPWTMSWGFGSLVVVLAALVVLFTGPLPPRKARVLFGVTYVVTFSACVIPIVLTVAAARSPYLLDTMRRAPIGILKAKAKGLEQPQWLVNVGGSVSEIPLESDSAPANPPPAQQRTTEPDTADPLVAPREVAISTNGAPSPAASQSAEVLLATSEPSRELEVKGGLAIPLYVLVLAMLGAGINMTRKVPQIQADYDSSASATATDVLTAPLAMVGVWKGAGEAGVHHPRTPSEIRKSLIETYMYFLSAPFLAVAVYYLLQVVASSVSEPVLVVIAFASGLMSNTAIGAIMTFADKLLEQQQDSAANTAAGQVGSPTT